MSAPASTADIKNKIKRNIVYHKRKSEKKKQKKKEKQKRKREEEALGEDAPPKKAPKTLDNTREFDETIVEPNDEEVLEDEKNDEFAEYFNDGKPPYILITTSIRPRAFVDELITVFPNSHYYKRGTFELKDIIKFAKNRDFTDLIVINEDKKKPNAMLIIHLPDGPTALFRINKLVFSEDIQGHGKATAHKPELILNNFSTRLGHSIGRMFAALLPQQPNFKGRRVVTFHNQRDFIFFRHHRYIFDEKGERCNLQELGPRFCLKLQTLQHGTFDTTHGEYEWFHKNDMDTSRRRFFL